MEFFNSRKFIAIILLVLIATALTGCANKKLPQQQTKNSQPTELDTIGRLDAISNVLGCMFNPKPCQDAKEQDLEADFED